MSAWFVNPGMLYLALGAVVPVIIHLLRRRRLVVVRLPTVRFLSASTRRAATRTNLKHLLLLALRMAVIMLTAVLLARPRPVGGASPATGRGAHVAPGLAIVVDDSLSMNYRRGEATWLDRARSAALELLERAPADAEVAVLTTGRPAAEPAVNHAEARARLLALRPTNEASTCWQALDRAAAALRERPGGERSICLLTDMTRSAWAGLEGRRSNPLRLGDDVALDVVSVGDPDAANAAVTALQHAGEPIVEGTVLSLKAELFCVGAPRQDAVQFEMDGRVVDRRPVALRPGETATVEFQAPIEARGHHWGRVGLLNTDGLPQDDARAFGLEAKAALRVLCVDAAAGRGWQAPSAFFAAALDPWSDQPRGVWRVRTIAPDKLESEPLGEVDLVALVDTPAPPPAAWARLADFVRGGGGLLVSTGEAADPTGYRDAQARLVLPAAPGDVQRAEGAAGLTVRVVDVRHTLALALEKAGVDVGRVPWRACRRLEPAAEAQEVLSFGPGLPALVMGGLGSGRAAVFAGGLDGRWSDFPRGVEFLPFCQELALHLTRTAAGALRMYEVGEQAPVDAASAALPTAVSVTAPGAQEPELLMPGTQPGHYVVWKTQRPGCYRVDFERGETRWSSGFGVNTTPIESDLRPVAPDEVRGAIRAGRVTFHKDTAGVALPGRGGVGGGRGFDPATLLALLALACCAGEVALANSIHRPAPADENEDAPPAPGGGSGAGL